MNNKAPLKWHPKLDPNNDDQALFPMKQVSGKWIVFIDKADVEVLVNDDDLIILKEKSKEGTE